MSAAPPTIDLAAQLARLRAAEEVIAGIQPIDPDNLPPAPCWVWGGKAGVEPHWLKLTAETFAKPRIQAILKRRTERRATHWHPDQPIAPILQP